MRMKIGPILSRVTRAYLRVWRSPGERGELLLQEIKQLINCQAKARKVKTSSIKAGDDL